MTAGPDSAPDAPRAPGDAAGELLAAQAAAAAALAGGALGRWEAALHFVLAATGWDAAVTWRAAVGDPGMRRAVALRAGGGDAEARLRRRARPPAVPRDPSDPGAPVWIDAPEGGGDMREGWATSVLVPLLHGDDAVGTLEMLALTPRPRLPGDDVALRALALPLAQAAALDDARARFDAVVDSTADAVVLADAAGRILLWNRGAEDMFGIPASRAVGGPLSAIVPPGHRAAHRDGFARAARGEGDPALYGRPLRLWGLHADGHEFPLELTLARWEGAERSPLFAGIARDVRERHAMETAARIVSEAAARLSAGGMDMDTTLRQIADSARDAVGAARASCYTIDPATRIVTGVHTTEADPERRRFLEAAVGRPPLDLPVWRRSAEHPEEVLIIEDVARDPSVPSGLAARLGAGALMAVRLEHPSVRELDGVALLGVLFLTFAAPRTAGADDVLVLRGLASLATLALANARLHRQTRVHLEEAERRAARDPLTGLANHRAFRERLAAEIARARRHDRPLSLAVFDIDHFKLINDTRGHQAGDQALIEVGRRLRAVSRPEDMVARLGGDEFAWLLPECDGADAWRAAEAARQAVAGADVAGAGTISLSGGVSELVEAGDAEGLYRLADGALYWAKAHGRGRVVRYSPQEVEVLSAEERVARLERGQALNALTVLARAVDAKDPSTRRHSARVADLAVRLAIALGWPAGDAAGLHEAGLMHDVGKIGVPDRILAKPGPLDDEEYALIKGHSVLGAQIVADVLRPPQVDWIRHHHERHDGRGYPDGLTGDAVPEGSRILAVADAWDVMVSARPYSAPRTPAEALAECRRVAGVQFAPAVVEALSRLVARGDLAAGESAADHVG